MKNDKAVNVAASEGFFEISDGTRLHYIEAGKGRDVLMVHGWACSSSCFRYQIDTLKSSYHVIAVDLRGHGNSDKPNSGYNIPRLAADINELIDGLHLKDVVCIGHSMGCSVLWSHFELYGSRNISKYVFIDECAMMFQLPTWTEEERLRFGGSNNADRLLSTNVGLKSSDGERIMILMLSSCMSPDVDETLKKQVIADALKADRLGIADLMFNHTVFDWTHVIPKINRPSLVIGGKASVTGYHCMEWISEAITDSELHIFEAEEHGSHFMFLENPQMFNDILMDFLNR